MLRAHIQMVMMDVIRRRRPERVPTGDTEVALELITKSRQPLDGGGKPIVALDDSDHVDDWFRCQTRYGSAADMNDIERGVAECVFEAGP